MPGSSPKQKFRVGPSLHRIPHFRFARAARGSFILPSVFVIRVDLDRKLLVGEDKLHQQWNAGRASQQSPRPFRWQGRPNFTESTPSVRP